MTAALIYMGVLIAIGMVVTVYSYKDEGGLREAFIPVEDEDE